MTHCESDSVSAWCLSILLLFSRGNALHVHVVSGEGEAKFWLEPTVSLATFDGLRTRELKQLQRVIEERQDEIKKAWKRHFGG